MFFWKFRQKSLSYIFEIAEKTLHWAQVSACKEAAQPVVEKVPTLYLQALQSFDEPQIGSNGAKKNLWESYLQF